MTPKQQRFVEEYLIDLNATQAYIRAGYSKNGAKQSAARMLTNADIRSAIKAQRAERASTSWLSQEWVLTQLLATYEQAQGLDQPSAATTALVKLGEHAGMWPKVIQVQDYRAEAQRVADKLGLDVEEVLAEAQRLTGSK